MIDFTYDEEHTNVDDNSEASNACSDLVPFPSVLILYPLFKHDIKEALILQINPETNRN